MVCGVVLSMSEKQVTMRSQMKWEANGWAYLLSYIPKIGQASAKIQLAISLSNRSYRPICGLKLIKLSS